MSLLKVYNTPGPSTSTSGNWGRMQQSSVWGTVGVEQAPPPFRAWEQKYDESPGIRGTAKKGPGVLRELLPYAPHYHMQD